MNDRTDFDATHESLIRQELDAMSFAQSQDLPEQAREHWDNAKALLANRRPEYVLSLIHI